jgi:hypothetical protein
MYQNHTVRKFLLGGFVGMTPAVVTQLTYPMLQNIRKYSLAFRWNPFYWNPVAKGQTWSGSVWFGRIVPQLLSWTLILCVLAIVATRKQFMSATPALAYLIAMKFHIVFPGWYWNTLPLVMFPLFLSNQRQRNELKRNWELMFQRAIWGTLLVGETTGLSAFLLWWLV